MYALVEQITVMDLGTCADFEYKINAVLDNYQVYGIRDYEVLKIMDGLYYVLLKLDVEPNGRAVQNEYHLKCQWGIE